MTEDHRLQRAVLQLAPLLALDVGLRGIVPSPDRVQGGGSDHDPREALSDRGDLARARVVSARLAAIPAPTRAVLVWIASGAYGLGLREASERYARAYGPAELRTAEEGARALVERAERSLSLAAVSRRQRVKAARSGVVLPASDAEATAQGHVEAARKALTGATRALGAWGRRELVRALAAWHGGAQVAA